MKLQRLYSELQESLAWINDIGLSNSDINHIKKELEKVLGIISSDLRFISSGKYAHVCIYSAMILCCMLYTIYSALSGHVRVYICVLCIVFNLELQRANNNYEEKLKSGCAAENTMFSLSWDIEELKYLNDEYRKMYSEIVECTNACSSEMFQQRNIPRRLTQIRKKLCDLHKRITHFKRIRATHIFVLMISSDTRNKKPYALPVQWFPYAGLKETDIRRLISNLCSKMISLE